VGIIASSAAVGNIAFLLPPLVDRNPLLPLFGIEGMSKACKRTNNQVCSSKLKNYQTVALKSATVFLCSSAVGIIASAAAPIFAAVWFLTNGVRYHKVHAITKIKSPQQQT